jgi:D-alanyl-D-alanine carboxypeptidase
MTKKMRNAMERTGRAAPAAALALALFAFAAAGLWSAGPRQAPADPLRPKLQAALDALHAAGTFPGMTVGIALADGTVLGLATGFADISTKTPLKPSDRMLAGSVGKTYVAAVAMQLVHEGKLKLEDKVEAWLGQEPWFARLPNARAITVRHLMNHTSGLVRYEFQESFTSELARQPDKVWRPEELVSYVLGLQPPFAPGQGWEYSDTNYIVLGMIMEKATGTLYLDLLRSRVLRPLGLDDTFPVESRTVPGLIQGYAGPGNPFGGTDEMIAGGRFAFNPQFEWTGGGVVSTAADLARWAKALYEGRAFDPSLLPAMLAGVPAHLGPGSEYGLGVIIRPTPLGKSYGHSGFFPGYLTEMMYFPEHKIAVAAQVNTSIGRAVGKSMTRVVLDLAAIAAGPGAGKSGPH